MHSIPKTTSSFTCKLEILEPDEVIGPSLEKKKNPKLFHHLATLTGDEWHFTGAVVSPFVGFQVSTQPPFKFIDRTKSHYYSLRLSIPLCI